ncbi:hypothetical protein [Geothrix fuzhouensis]|uniref:hypothetical protein n=1 Tax=Geothrix fuzhouensis TaxID=2966451 RepID=UPI002149484C|nr:hypothetical protein [Geothrix fuzhouensis]
MQPTSNSQPNYQVEFKTTHASRPGFRINELRISPSQCVRWHYHNHIQDTFPPLRPHLITNPGQGSATFLNLQGIGAYDLIPCLETDTPDE